MSRLKKILIALAGLICVAIVLLMVLAKMLITPERVRESIVPLVTESLHRDLQIGEIEISLLSGIVLHDVVLTEHDVMKTFVSVEKAVLRYRLWPLLLLRVEIDELRLERPHVQISRFSDGTFNFSDMIVSSDDAVPEQSGQTSDSGVSPVSVHVSEIVIADGTIVFIDLADAGGAQTISALNLTIQDFSTTQGFQASVTADWNSNAFELSGRFDLVDRSVDAFFRLNATRLRVKGDLLADVKGDRLRAEITLPAIAISELLGSLPDNMLMLPAELNLSGRLAAQIVLDGLVSEPGNLLRSGQIDLDHVIAQSGSLQSDINGSVVLKNKSIKTEKFVITVNNQRFVVDAQIVDFMRRPVQAKLNVSSVHINLDRFLPAAKEGNDAVPSAEPLTQEEIGPFDLPLDLTATIQVEELLYRGLLVRNLAARLNLKKNRLTIDQADVEVADGTIKSSGHVNLGVKGLRYGGVVNLYNIKINPVVSVLQPELSESIFGVVNGQLETIGAGTVPAIIKKNISGIGRFDLSTAKLTRIPALDSAADLLGVAELSEITVDEGHVVLKIDNGVADLDLKTKSVDFRQSTNGTISFAGQLRLRSTLSFSPKLSKKLDRRKVTGGVLTDEDGWTHVPIRVKGNYTSPKVVLDMTAISRQAQQGAIDKWTKKLRKKIGRDDSGPDSSQEDDPASQLINKALKGLFGN
jgi:AsmA protein